MRVSGTLLLLPIAFLSGSLSAAPSPRAKQAGMAAEMSMLDLKPAVPDTLRNAPETDLLAEAPIGRQAGTEGRSSDATAEESAKPPGLPVLLGNPGGARSWLAEKGVTLELEYKGDFWTGVSGGLYHGHAYLDNLDYKIGIDGEKLIGWKGSSFLVSFLTNNGSNPSEVAGDAQGISNIAAYSTTKLYQAWLDITPFSGNVSILAGLYDLNSEFYVTNTSGVFLHPTQGIGIEIAQTGSNGPSIFPTTALATRVKYTASASTSVQAVVLDGVAGDPDDRSGTHIKFGREYGALIVAEADHVSGGDGEGVYRKLGIGVWSYTGAFDDVAATDAAGSPLRRSDNHGLYLIAESDLLREAGEGTRGVAAFIRAGIANGHINQFASCVAGGLVATGIIPGRDSDLCGIAFGVARNGSAYMDLMNAAGTPAASAEVALEFTYRASILEWLAVQPDFEYIIDPGTDRTIPNACLFGIRFQVSM